MTDDERAAARYFDEQKARRALYQTAAIDFLAGIAHAKEREYRRGRGDAVKELAQAQSCGAAASKVGVYEVALINHGRESMRAEILREIGEPHPTNHPELYELKKTIESLSTTKEEQK